jgi:hypothetical protein
VLAATPVAHVTATAAVAAPGANLLLNPEATVGATSARGWDAVTIPGWQVAGGLPTVVRYGTPGFPKTAKSWPGNRGNLSSPAAPGGTAKLVQQTSVTPNARYDIAGWLGGTKTSAAELTVQFTDASGRILATAAIGPAGKQAKPVLEYRQAAGPVPAGATRARATITLTTTLTDWNGPVAPQTGYNYATAADIGLTQAPYLNSLRRRGATLTNFYAEEHPSDANYLALAGGSAFGVPLTPAPKRKTPLYNIDAENIGDLVTARAIARATSCRSRNSAATWRILLAPRISPGWPPTTVPIRKAAASPRATNFSRPSRPRS